ncbi:MAG: ABC transporter permease [Rhizobiaceae bacterium]|nr:MAG: ABC transporter permease [Rhizobiaceae bacterium]
MSDVTTFSSPVETSSKGETGKISTVSFRGGGFAPIPVQGVGIAVFVVLIALAEIGTRSGFISNLTLPRPSAVLDTFVQLWQTGLLWKHLLPSLQRLFVGAFMGISVGIAVGVLIGLFSYVRAGLVPLVAALFPIPKIALLPLFVIWFGWSIVRKIVLPGAFPAILSGLRVSISIAIILLVAAEMLGAQYGVGSYILEAGSLYDLEKLFAGVTILSVMGLLVNFVIGQVEKRFLSWRG